MGEEQKPPQGVQRFPLVELNADFRGPENS
jgi:hypothetical protein